jgi:hypothetical protein
MHLNVSYKDCRATDVDDGDGDDDDDDLSIYTIFFYLFFSIFLMVCPCFTFKKYTGTSKFPVWTLI